MICTIALNVELSYKECGWQTPFKWTKRSVGFPYPFSGICRTRMYDKFRPRYSADVRKHPTPMAIQLHPQCLLGIQSILRNWTFLIFKQV